MNEVTEVIYHPQHVPVTAVYLPQPGDTDRTVREVGRWRRRRSFIRLIATVALIGSMLTVTTSPRVAIWATASGAVAGLITFFFEQRSRDQRLRRVWDRMASPGSRACTRFGPIAVDIDFESGCTTMLYENVRVGQQFETMVILRRTNGRAMAFPRQLFPDTELKRFGRPGQPEPEGDDLDPLDVTTVYRPQDVPITARNVAQPGDIASVARDVVRPGRTGRVIGTILCVIVLGDLMLLARDDPRAALLGTIATAIVAAVLLITFERRALGRFERALSVLLRPGARSLTRFGPDAFDIECESSSAVHRYADFRLRGVRPTAVVLKSRLGGLLIVLPRALIPDQELARFERK